MSDFEPVGTSISKHFEEPIIDYDNLGIVTYYEGLGVAIRCRNCGHIQPIDTMAGFQLKVFGRVVFSYYGYNSKTKHVILTCRGCGIKDRISVRKFEYLGGGMG